MPKSREVFSVRDVIDRLEAAYGALVYPTRLMSTWPHHRPMFLRLPGKQAGEGFLSRALIEAGLGHQLLVVAPSHMETKNVQKLISAATGVLFLSRRLNADEWSEGVLLAGLNIEIKPELSEFGVIMEKRRAVIVAPRRDAFDRGGLRAGVSGGAQEGSP